MSKYVRVHRKRFTKNYASLPLPNPDVFKYPDDYDIDVFAGEEYLYAVKRHQALLDITPDLTPPQEKNTKIDTRLKSLVLPTEPVRKIPRSAVRVTGLRHNSKGPYPAHWESSIECDFLTLLEFDPAVRCYYTQPMEMSWTDTKGIKHTYTPDILVIWYPDEYGQPVPNWLVDMKSASELTRADPLLLEKLRAGKEYARSKGWIFKDITELQIRSPLLNNAKFLHRALHAPSSPAAVDVARLIIRRLYGQSSPTPATILETFPKEEQPSAAFVLWMLVSRREILCDLTAPLDEEKTVLSLPQKYTEEWIMRSIISGKEAKKLNGHGRKRTIKSH